MFFFITSNTYSKSDLFVKRLLYPIFNLPIKNAEKNAAKYADLIFVLTERDRNEVQNWKNKTPIVLLPSSLKDTYRNYPEKNLIA